ncbi:MAG: hypothetical protein ACPGXK_13965 [Phycisphaerae bacterium]
MVIGSADDAKIGSVFDHISLRYAMAQVVDTSKIAEVIDRFTQDSERAMNGEDPVAYARVESQLCEIDGYVREVEQAMWAEDAAATLAHLEQGASLTDRDREVIRTFLMSDATNEGDQGQELADSVSELHRLIEALQDQSDVVTRDNIGDLRATLREAMRLFPEIRQHMAERDRIARFDCAVEDPDAATRRTLIKIMREQLCDPDA